VHNVTPATELGQQIFYVDRTPEFSVDGSRLAVAGTERRLVGCFLTPGVPETRIWVFDTENGSAVRRIQPPHFGVGELQLQLPQGYAALSPLGRWLVVEVYPGEAGHLAAIDLETGRIHTIAPSLPDPTTLAAHWDKRAGGWSLGSPPALLLPLTGGDDLIRPARLSMDGSAPQPILPEGRHSDGPILLSPHGRTLFFVEGETVWRVDADGNGLVSLTGGQFAGLELRLEVAR
jgi:hypothetical protein